MSTIPIASMFWAECADRALTGVVLFVVTLVMAAMYQYFEHHPTPTWVKIVSVAGVVVLIALIIISIQLF